MSVLVIAEHNHQLLNPTTENTINAASQLGEVTVLVAGYNCEKVATATANIEGVTRVLLCEDDRLQHHLAETLADFIITLASDYSHLVATASTFGKNLMPRIAALLDVSQVSDIIQVIDENTFKRSIYAGNAIATVQSLNKIKVVTVRASAFESAESSNQPASIDRLKLNADSELSQFISQQLSTSDRPELTSAAVVVSGGRGIGNKENFSMLEELADQLNGAVGASRAAVDSGYAPNDYQVGQTGKIVAPDLYFAIAISGAIQHLAGMKDSKVIVAINNDEEAPIFGVADYGLVADCFEAVPELIKALEA